MTRVLIIVLFILSSIGCYSQKLDSILFREVAKENIIKYLEIKKSKQYYWDNINLNDTNNIQFHIAILLLKEQFNSELNYLSLTPYIEKNFSLTNQCIYIENKVGSFILRVDKESYQNNKRMSIESGSIMPE